MRTVVRVTVRVVVVILLLSAASAPTVATFDGKSTATFNYQSFNGDASDERAGDELLSLLSQSSDRAIPVDGGKRTIPVDISERFERAVQCGLQSLCESDKTLSYLGVVLGYSRYDGSDPLENELRENVYKTITASPGIYIAKLSNETTIHRSTVRYHVRVLEEEGLVSETVLQGKHRLYPAEQNNLSLIAALDEEATAAVLQALLRLEPASVSLLADDLDRAPSTVSHHLTRLADEGLVTRERDRNTVCTRLLPHVRETLQSAETGSLEGKSMNVRADS